MPEKTTRMTFGKLSELNKIKMTPYIRKGMGSLFLEHADGQSFISDDVVLVFKDTKDISDLVTQLLILKSMMTEKGEQK